MKRVQFIGGTALAQRQTQHEWQRRLFRRDLQVADDFAGRAERHGLCDIAGCDPGQRRFLLVRFEHELALRRLDGGVDVDDERFATQALGHPPGRVLQLAVGRGLAAVDFGDDRRDHRRTRRDFHERDGGVVFMRDRFKRCPQTQQHRV